MISRTRRAFASADSAEALTSVASDVPSNVVGEVALAGVAAFDALPWCDGFVLVTSLNSASSTRRPVP